MTTLPRSVDVVSVQVVATELELDLEAVNAEGEASTRYQFSVPATVAVPSKSDTFLVYRQRYRFTPGLASAELADEGLEPDPLADDEVAADADDAA